MLDEQLFFLHAALIASNVYCEVANKFLTMNYVQFLCHVVKIRLQEHVLGLMRSVKYRTCKKGGKGMKRKRRPKFVSKLKNMVLVTCDWSEDGGSRLRRNADKYLKTYAVSENHDIDLCTVNTTKLRLESKMLF